MPESGLSSDQALDLALWRSRTRQIDDPCPFADFLAGRRHARPPPAHRYRRSAWFQGWKLKPAVFDGTRGNPSARRGDAFSDRDHRRDFGSVDFDPKSGGEGQQSLIAAVVQHEVNARLFGGKLNAIQDHPNTPPFEGLTHLDDAQWRPYTKPVGDREA